MKLIKKSSQLENEFEPFEFTILVENKHDLINLWKRMWFSEETIKEQIDDSRIQSQFNENDTSTCVIYNYLLNKMEENNIINKGEN